MKRLLALSCLVLTLTACRKDDGSFATGLIPGSCNYATAQSYTGAITAGTCFNGQPSCQNPYQDIAVVYNPDRNDRITVIMCKNADCDTTIPATFCSSLAFGDTTTPCKTVTPSVNIVYGNNMVRFVAAQSANYQGYNVTTQVCL